MQKEDFLNAIAADPGNSRLRLMFADWLEERGDPLAAEWRKPIRQIPLAVDYAGEGFGDGLDGGFGAGPFGAHGDGPGAGEEGYEHGEGFGAGEHRCQALVREYLRIAMEVRGLTWNVSSIDPPPDQEDAVDEEPFSYPYYRNRPSRGPGKLTFPVTISWFFTYLAGILAVAHQLGTFLYQRNWEFAEYVASGVVLLMLIPSIGIWGAEAFRSLGKGKFILMATGFFILAVWLALLILQYGAIR